MLAFEAKSRQMADAIQNVSCYNHGNYVKVKNLPKVITNLERTIAYMEGIHAFDTGTQREHNPYIGKNEDLIRAWWIGWDAALNEKNAGGAGPSK